MLKYGQSLGEFINVQSERLTQNRGPQLFNSDCISSRRIILILQWYVDLARIVARVLLELQYYNVLFA